MRYLHFTGLVTLLSMTLIMSSCNQKSKSGEKEKALNNKDTAQMPVEYADTLPKINQPGEGDFSYLRKMAGKYPNDVKLLDDPKLTARLRSLLGDRFNFLKETWAVEVPIEIKGDDFIASGCQQHNCGSTNFIIVVDLSKNLLYAGIREEEKVKTYAENGGSSQAVIDWSKGN
ncbi:MAG TPA: hypothetical protein VLJ68_13435 [Chitinophagaceae bacterium]|nr:hypothetical protein [Chitinophagaceae bacterium]